MNVEFPFRDAEQYGDVRTVAALAGVELRGKDGDPYCCDRRMTVKGGLWGPDFARCEACGTAMWNAASPHINGGVILREEVLDAYGECLWRCQKGGADRPGGESGSEAEG